ncbi:hypothetical protein MHN79_12595 [Vibrio sp. Of14-4]|uniref:hypothetical protein n=1 Tax=Vibrio sp. Of14-4 TaxID=2724878 RepID=UPI001EF34BC6|nr:hypothetical protein [Vibrio sp. Of14-4]MCG7490328.1 hypothetical protein [Vibrio sp. Of14-4]
MLTQDVSHELTEVIQQIQSEGKDPTVALVRARLNTSVPIPALIKVIKDWKHSKHVPKVEVSAKEVNSDEKIAKLEKQITDLTMRLDKLEKKLSQG